jgi:AcrR family transcriptional regulator
MPRLKAAQRRDQLIEVATRVFAKSGYDAATTAAIARAAGVTEPILYRHFKNKEDLFVAIVRSVSESTLEHWRKLVEDIPDPAEKIRRIGTAFPGHVGEMADAYRVMHGALATSRDRKVIAVMKEHYSKFEEFFCAIIAEGRKSGVFHSHVQGRVFAWHLITIGIGYAMISQNLSHFDHDYIEQAIDLILRGVER